MFRFPNRPVAGMLPGAIRRNVFALWSGEQMLKSTIRKAARTLRRWVEDPNGPVDSWAAPYTLNSIYSKIMDRPGCDHDYAWGVMQGVNLARVLGLTRVSVIEFGVAGGNGLLTLERIAETAESIFGVNVDVFGFDTGTGLPKPKDYRDMPNVWSEGFFPMDVEKLKSQLKRAQLVLGPVGETVRKFTGSTPSPVAFIGFDLDLYTSTRDAFGIFEGDQRLLLPRVYCYFDDIMGFTFGDHVGERLAISEFTASHDLRKLSPIYGLEHYVPRRFANRWWGKYYMAPIFDHESYGTYDGTIGGSGVCDLSAPWRAR